MSRLESVKKAFVDKKIVVAIMIAVVIAILQTVVSMQLYNLSNVSRLDASAPGYEELRSKITSVDSEVDFSSSGAIDKNTLKTFQAMFDKERSDLNALGKFEGDELNLSSLTANGNE